MHRDGGAFGLSDPVEELLIPTRILSNTRRRVALRLTLLAVTGALLVAAPAANAADLLVLGGETVTLSGTNSYGFVYLDGELRITGDTTISAGSIYFGPNAALRPCFVEGSGNTACTTGRALTLRSSGALTVAPGIDLTAGTGTPRNGGALTLEGAQVSVGGTITTTASNGGVSGPVSITSSGPINVGAITAWGASVTLKATGPIDIGGDVQTQGVGGIAAADTAHTASAGPVSVTSSSGDVRIDGTINASGVDAPGASGSGLSGGSAAAVSISGSDVRLGSVDATGGSSTDAGPGASAPITLAARGNLSSLGRLDAGGQNSTNVAPTAGAPIAATAGGILTLAGGAWSSGAQSTAGGSAGGEITLKGQSVIASTIYVPGGSASNSGTPHAGGPGGVITVGADGPVSTGSLFAGGGNAPTGAGPGRGGSVSVTSATASIATGQVNTQAGSTGGGAGGSGGPIALSAQVDLTVGGTLNASGSNASGDATPPRPGGDSGSVLLRAATGTLSLGNDAYAEGGTGAGEPVAGRPGALGGHGGRVDIVAKTIGSIVSLSSHGGAGGDFGDDQGPGGAAGPIYTWSESQLFDDQRVVNADGGSGHPVGTAGLKQRERMPSAPTIDATSGAFGFTSQSPDALAYRILRSVNGAAQEMVSDGTKTAGIPTTNPVCVPVTYTVIALHSGVGWVSDAPATVSFLKPPSATQGCADAPELTPTKRLRFSLRALRKAKWRVTLPVRSSGIGSVDVALKATGRKAPATPLATQTLKVAGAGPLNLKLALSSKARKRGRYRVELVTTAPDGKTHATTTLTLEVRK